MAYADQWNLWNDAGFQGRLQACTAQESIGRVEDPLTDAILENPALGLAWFLPFVTSHQDIIDAYAAGGSESIADEAILSAVQADWARVAAVHAS